MTGSPVTGSLVALDQARSRAERLLGERFAQGLIDDDELDSRLDRVLDAVDAGEVHDVVQDLLDPGTRLDHVEHPSDPSQALVPRTTATALAVDIRDLATFSTWFGEQHQRGVWVPGRVNEVRTRFADSQFDLREARLGPGTTEFRLNVILSEVEFIVPPGMRVDVETSVLLGSVTHDEPAAAPDPAAPRIRITGRVVLSEVTVREREPGESKRDARRRRRRARKLTRAKRKALRSAEPR